MKKVVAQVIVPHIQTMILLSASATSPELRGRRTGGQCTNRTLELFPFLVVVRFASAREQ
jgi:hypothetical protein